MKINDHLSEGLDGFISLTLMRGCDDFVMAAEIVDNTFNLDGIFKDSVSSDILREISEAEKIGGPVEFAIARDMSIAIIRKVLTECLMMIGDLHEGFHPWRLSIEESLQKVRSEWEELNGKLPGLGVYWLANTKSGEAIGQMALKRWQEDYKLIK
jgi:hypothetical protein